MKVLITGGAGYIGSTLTQLLLQQGHDVRVLDILLNGGDSMLGVWAHPKFQFVNGDIRDPDTVNKAVSGMDAIVHLAAIVGDPACANNPELSRTTNIDGSRLMFEASLACGVKRFIFASTCSNYGRMKDTSVLADEACELKPISLYAETKVTMEETLLDFNKDDFAPTVLRFATVYGVSPRMRFDLTVNEFTMEMITKGHLEVFGEQFWRPYVHVRDVAGAISDVLSAPSETISNQVFNVGSTEQNYQKGTLVELIRPYAPGVLLDYVQRNEDPRDYRVSFDKIASVLSFKVKHTVESGISEVADLVRGGLISDYDDPKYRN